MKTDFCPSTSAAARSDRLPIAVAVATEQDRPAIYGVRHEVYARELRQHSPNGAECLRDALDDRNLYLVAKIGGEMAGFISVTPPGRGGYSIDKYVTRQALPFPCDDRLYEVRLLTVLKPYRGRTVAALLMYAAFRWVEAHGGTRLVAIGRREVVDIYLRSGLEPVGITVSSGAVTYDLLQATTLSVRERLKRWGGLLDRLERSTDWRLSIPFRQPAACFHGGEFFAAIGIRFEALGRRHEIINADVLDAWFPPAPGVLATLHEHGSWLLRTSPPTGGEGLIETIASARGVAPDNILPGAGSSDLIFRALRHWLTPASQVLILDPTYGEYVHVLENVIGCTVDRLVLARRDHYALDLERLRAALAEGYDLLVLVNPNSPTGCHVGPAPLEKVLRQAPDRTRIWIDETYVEYAGAGQSLERFAAGSENVVVCKSMSKVYALSGARVAYLCAGPHQLEELRGITPPWVVSLPGQVAAVRALQDPDYYAARYQETSVLREQLADGLQKLGLSVVPGIANFILGHLPADGPEASRVTSKCRESGLFVREASSMGSQMDRTALRLAVKDHETNQRMIQILGQSMAACGEGARSPDSLTLVGVRR